MKKILFLIMIIALSGSLRAQNNVINDANAQVRDAKDFHAVEVSNAIDLYLSQSDNEAVAVSAKDVKNRDHIVTKVENGVLKIWFEKEGWRWNDGNKKLKAYVSFKMLDRLSASGASDIYVNGAITADHLELHLSGASDFKGSVKLNSLSLDQSGASDATINGIVGNLQVEASGASET
jgi:hypothetical protein